MNLKQKIESGKIAKFTTEVKKEILQRDKSCIVCLHYGSITRGSDFHHPHFGPMLAKYNDPDRNKAISGVLLCTECHHEIHHGIKGVGKEFNNICLQYLEDAKKKETNRKTKSN